MWGREKEVRVAGTLRHHVLVAFRIIDPGTMASYLWRLTSSSHCTAYEFNHVVR
jgi:hypothetical protein